MAKSTNPRPTISTAEPAPIAPSAAAPAKPIAMPTLEKDGNKITWKDTGLTDIALEISRDRSNWSSSPIPNDECKGTMFFRLRSGDRTSNEVVIHFN